MYYSKLLFIVLLISACTKSADMVGQVSFTESFSVNDGPIDLSVSTFDGLIEVGVGTPSEVKVEFFVKRKGQMTKINRKQLEDLIGLEITQEGNVISVHATNPDKKTKISVSMVVTTPQHTSTNLATSKGNVVVSNLIGKQHISSTGGGVNMENIEGNIIAYTSDGNIEGRGLTGDFTFSASKGDVKLRKVNGNINNSVAHGDVNMTGVTGSVNTSVSSGAISIDLLEASGPINLSCSNGDIKLNVPETQGYDLNLSASEVMITELDFSGDQNKKRANGKLSGGGYAIDCHVSGGQVSVY